MSVLPNNRDPSSLAATGHNVEYEKQKLRGAGGGEIFMLLQMSKCHPNLGFYNCKSSQLTKGLS